MAVAVRIIPLWTLLNYVKDATLSRTVGQITAASQWVSVNGQRKAWKKQQNEKMGSTA